LSEKTYTKIALGDLRHSTCGRHSVFMPVGIGYIASYALSRTDLAKEDIKLYDDPEKILKDIEEFKPDIVALSNYCWNSEVSCLVFRYAKKINPKTICIAGGPEFPKEREECREYLMDRKEIDFYVYREGEVAFANLIRELQKGSNVDELKSRPLDGIMSNHPKTGELVVGKPLPRITNLDEITSPYLTGLMDKWFDGHYAPSMEIVRGCPFTCAFCNRGYPWYSKVARFSIGRTKAELDYIAERMKDYPSILLAIWDSNFGMYPEDEEVAKYIGGLQDKFDWPNAFNVSTGKGNYDRILRIISILKNKMQVSCSVQSLNDETLKVIKRKNLFIDEYKELQKGIKKKGMVSIGELIMPMPEETKASFFESIRILFDNDIDSIVPYTTMLLKGTPLASKEYKKRYDMETKFRLLPRQFGEYKGEKIFEVEEACVATNTMSFEEYLEGRGFAFISALVSSEQFDVISRHLKELRINKYDFLFRVFKLIKAGKSELSLIYNQFIEETKKELWDSKEELLDFFRKQENYNDLLIGRFGDNLMRKYKAKVFKEKGTEAIELVYEIIKELSSEKQNNKVLDSLDAAKQWVIACRNVWAVFEDKSYRESVEVLHLPYDVDSWYKNNNPSKPLISFNNPVDYEILCDAANLTKMISQWEHLYGKDPLFQFRKAIMHWSIKYFWRECKSI